MVRVALASRSSAVGSVLLVLAGFAFSNSAIAAGRPGPNAVAQPAAFGAAIRVMDGRFTSVAEVVDSNDHVHVAGTNGSGLWYATDRTGGWVVHRLLTNGSNSAWFESSIALDDSNHVYIAVAHTTCADCVPGGSDGIYLLSDSGRQRDTFPGTPTNIVGSGAGQISLKIFAGKIFIAYLNNISGHGPLPKVLLKTNVTGRWTKAVVAPHGWDTPSLRIGSDGRPRVAYASRDGLGYAVAQTPSGSFTTSVVPGTTFAAWYDFDPILSLDANDRARIAWSHTEPGHQHTKWAWQLADGWHGPFTIPASGGRFGFDVDTFNRPHVVFQNGDIVDQVRTRTGWHSRVVASSMGFKHVVVRRALGGRVAVAWAGSGGVWVARN